jgi:alpha-tubulin suppressor-like RCC1 family protein
MRTLPSLTQALQSLRRVATASILHRGLPVLFVALAALSLASTADATISVSAGITHTCSVTEAGRVVCWGENNFGQLGNGTTTSSTTPVAVSGLSSGVQEVAAGGAYTCALTGAGAVECWGRNAEGQLGNGTTTSSTTPVAVSGLSSGVVAIAAGAFHACALTRAGAAVCWGNNGSGQLGDGTTTTRTTPVTVSGLSSGVVAITTGREHTCAVTLATAAMCWGNNSEGQLGDGTTANRLTPVTVSGLSHGVKEVAAGGFHTCARTEAGAALCWGKNGSGQLGNGTTLGSPTPVGVSGLSSGVNTIAAGEEYNCALTEAGAVECWGNNVEGQLGDGTATSRLAPVPVSGLSSGVTRITANRGHTCALTGARAAVCWGNNLYGQIGDGTTTNRLTPVAVARTAQTITFPAVPSHTLGDPDIAPGASASSGLAVTYTTRTPAVCTIVSAHVHLVAAGECSVAAEQGGSAEFTPAGPVERSFAVAAVVPIPVVPTPVVPTPVVPNIPGIARLTPTPTPTPTATVPMPKVVLHRSGTAGRRRWTFVSTSAVPAVRFYCRMDKALFRPCRSPRVYRHLTRGHHVFAVKAVSQGVESAVNKRRFIAKSNKQPR